MSRFSTKFNKNIFCKPSKFYFILISGRCGSTLLMHYLGQIPDIVCYPEFFVGLSKQQQIERFNELVSARPVRGYLGAASCSGFADALHRGDRVVPTAIGAKTKYGDLADYHGLMREAGNQGFKVIPMYRRNLLKSAISRIRAQIIYERYQDYNIPAGSESLGRMLLPLNDLDRLLGQERRYIDDINSLAGQYFAECTTVTYEDLLEDLGATLDYVLTFLGSRYRVTVKAEGAMMAQRDSAPPLQLAEKIVKATSDDLSEAVENYAELERHLKGTYYEQFLT